MRLLIGVIEGKFITYHFWGPPTQGKASRKTRKRRELELTLKQPEIQQNLEFWSKAIESKKSYGLLILMDNNKGTKSYVPIETKEEFEQLLSLGQMRN